VNIGSELKKEPDVKGFFNYLKTPEAREETEELVSALPWHVSGWLEMRLKQQLKTESFLCFAWCTKRQEDILNGREKRNSSLKRFKARKLKILSMKI